MLNPSILKAGVSETDTDVSVETNQSRNDENYENVETRNDKTDETEGVRMDLRRSTRERKQRISISPDEIGECDDEKDVDYN